MLDAEPEVNFDSFIPQAGPVESALEEVQRMSFFDRCVRSQYENQPLYSLDVDQHEQAKMQCEVLEDTPDCSL